MKRLLEQPAADANQASETEESDCSEHCGRHVHLAVMKLLLERDADPSITSNFGTSLSRAEAKSHGEVAALLRG